MESEKARKHRQEWAREYYRKHREEIIAKSKAYIKAHPEKSKEYRGHTTEERKEWRREYQRLYYQANKEKCKEYIRRWQANHPDKVKAYMENHRKLNGEKKERKAKDIPPDTEKAKALFRDPKMADHLQWLVDHAKAKETNQETI